MFAPRRRGTTDVAQAQDVPETQNRHDRRRRAHRPEAPRVRRVRRREHRVVRDRFHRLRQGVRVLHLGQGDQRAQGAPLSDRRARNEHAILARVRPSRRDTPSGRVTRADITPPRALSPPAPPSVSNRPTRVRRFRLTPSLFIPPPSTATQGSLTKIEDLIKAYGAPVVSKVQEKYPTYMTTVDAKVRPPPAEPRRAPPRTRSEIPPAIFFL
jgi:hypothetical protein